MCTSDNWYDLVDDMFENNYINTKKPKCLQQSNAEHVVAKERPKKLSRIQHYPIEIQNILSAWYNATNRN